MRDYWLTQYILSAIGWGYLIVVFIALVLVLWLAKGKMAKTIAALVVLGLASILPLQGYQEYAKEKVAVDAYRVRLAKAGALFDERCKTAGEKIYRTVENVEGILLPKLRPEEINFSDQFAMNDPYGQLNANGASYLEQFLYGRQDEYWVTDKHKRGAYQYVDSSTGKGAFSRTRLAEVLAADGQMKLEPRTTSVAKPSEYSVEWADTSTNEDRVHWIACGALYVRDTSKKELLAERTGCIFDRALGNTSGGRSPWAFALDMSCPSNRLTPDGRAYHEPVDRNFVERVLKPLKAIKQ